MELPDQLPVELPEDMVREIMKKVPVTARLRFSCVCKAWRNMVIQVINPHLDYLIKHCIDHPNVVFLRRSYNYENLHEASLLTDKMLPIAKCDSTNLELEVMGACNGIVSLAHESIVHLYNPITREDLELPPGLLANGHYKRNLGFGFDASCNDFKVVRIMDQEIYKHSTRCWTKFDSNYDYRVYIDHFDEGGVFLNGFFHWPILRIQGPQGSEHRQIILTFNFETERFGQMYYPRQQLMCMEWECLPELDNSLAVCSNVGAKVEVWVMKEHGKKESWTKAFSVEFGITIIRVISFRVRNMRLEVLGVYKWGQKENAVA